MTALFIEIDADFSPSAGPVIGLSETERLIANMPGIRFWLDPQSKFEPAGAGEGIRDRIGYLNSVDYNNHHYTLDAQVGGQPTISFAAAASQGLNFSGASDFAWLAGGYTWIFVAKQLTSGQFVPFIAANAANKFKMQASAAGHIAIYHNATGVSAVNVFDTSAHIWMVCWDAGTKSIRLERDGVAQSLSAGTLAPTPDISGATMMGIGSTDGAGICGDAAFGFSLGFDRSYAAPAYASHRAALLTALGAKYGISVTV